MVLVILSAQTGLPAICTESSTSKSDSSKPDTSKFGATTSSAGKVSTPLEHNNKGVELGSKGMWPEAIKEHLLAMNGEPDNTMFRQNLSSAYLHYGDILKSKFYWQEAIKSLRQAVYADPNNAPADQSEP